MLAAMWSCTASVEPAFALPLAALVVTLRWYSGFLGSFCARMSTMISVERVAELIPSPAMESTFRLGASVNGEATV